MIEAPKGYSYRDSETLKQRARRGEELRCRRCGFRKRIATGQLYALADEAVRESRTAVALPT